MQISQFPFQQDMIMVGTGNIARATGAGAHFVQGLMHGGQNFFVLSHAQIIIRAPDGNVLLSAIMISGRLGKFTGLTLQLGEDAIAPFTTKVRQSMGKQFIVIHG